MTSLIAMQKVVGSNPISRFDANSLHRRKSPSAAETGTLPSHRLHFGN